MLARLARQRNLRQQEACLARPNPQRSQLNPRLVVAPVLLDPLVPPPEQGLARLASNNHSNHSSSLRGLGSVRLVKLSHSNRPASALAVLVPHSRSNKPLVSLVILLSVKSPPPLDSVRAPSFYLVISTDTSKVPRLRLQALSVPAPGPLLRPSHRPLPLELHLNNPRVVHSVLGHLAPVSSMSRASVLT